MSENEENKKPDKAREPLASYGTGDKKIVFFKSFEEENEYTHRQYAALSPEERLASVTFMRITNHPYLNTNLNPWGNVIYFD